ncbi:hypothetical protein HUT18_17205 [Streptomyces sp. NA04227]|uniref:DUF6585 family protein n=1 Tax=Streptomyces sp. NA04227 TaxID=2742136 RepID=UPI0015903271|nr:DUF6585 family protein [Streptomyces sp. NA04227]QKW07867.1 hypothetical protein HUT18_17205 [Streptomyces sp. NA04227]
MEHIHTEPPTSSVVALAGEWGFGGWLRTYASRQSWMYKKWRDWRLYLYDGGVVVTAPSGYEAAFDWGTSRVLQYLRTINGSDAHARYTLIDPYGDAVNIGPGANLLTQKWQERLGINSSLIGPPILGWGEWGEHIQLKITEAQLADVLGRIARGETAQFGPINADRHGLLTGEQEADWAEIDRVRLADGTVQVVAHNGELLLDGLHEIGFIPNLDLFLHVCEYFTARD